MEQWEIQRSEGVCAGTGKKMEPGQEYYAALIDQQTHFERRDYCCEYWQEQQPKVFSFWKTRMPSPTQKKNIFVDDSVLINFFERLAEEKEPMKVNFRFVLALILMRKRQLKYEDSRWEGEKEIWRMRLVRQSDIHELENPHLQEEQIQQLAQELSSILQGEL